MSAADSRPLIAHVVYRFDIGGLENGVVNLLNRLPRERWRHAVVALTDLDSLLARPAIVDAEYRPVLSAPEERANGHLQHRALAPCDDANLDAVGVPE